MGRVSTSKAEAKMVGLLEEIASNTAPDSREKTKRPVVITYKAEDGAQTFIATEQLAAAQAVDRGDGIFGVIVFAAGGATMVVKDALTEEQANAIVHYVRATMLGEELDRTKQTNLNRIIAEVRERMPQSQILVPDENVIPIGR